jgi:glycosyltransferase involved in cell wall biosynthesis
MVLENSRYPLDSRVRKEAESLTQAGRSVEVLAPREAGRPRRELIHGVQVTRFPLADGGGTLLGTLAEYLSALPVIGVAVIWRIVRSPRGTLHVHNPPDFFFPLLWLARLRGWSTVFDHHDDAAGMLRAKVGRPTGLERVLERLRRRSAQAADLTITTNDTQRRLVERSARSVAVVRNGPPDWFARHRPSPPAARTRIVFLGEIGAQDRVERAVEILALLVQERGLDVELLVVGDGPRRRAVEERAAQLDVAARIEVTGWVPYEQVPVTLASAHVGLDTAPPTDVNHGSTMIKIAEYLAVGLPVVASGLRETKVTGGGAIIAVDDDCVTAMVDPIARLLTDVDAWVLAHARAADRGEALHWPAQAATLLAAYDSVGACIGGCEP